MSFVVKEGALPLAALGGSPQGIFAKMKGLLDFILAANTPAGGARLFRAFPFAVYAERTIR
jgi:hypothetical protein